MRRPTIQSLFQLGLGAATASLLLGLVALQTIRQMEARHLLMELVDNHARSVLAGHLVDIASSDPHAVRAWFDGKVKFAAPVPDLSAAGYELAGGRMDYISGHSTAALVYQLNKHEISVFLWPDSNSASATPTLEPPQLGYNIIAWESGPLTARAVSDLPAKDLRDFAAAFAAKAQP